MIVYPYLCIMKNDIKQHLINSKNIQSMVKKPIKDFNVKRLLNNPTLDQSQSIRFGKVFESFIKSIISELGHPILYEDLVSIPYKGQKDVDLCFIKDDVVYYFECKINLNLDSEKSKATDEKIDNIEQFLKTKHPGKTIVVGCLTCWYEKEAKMHITPKVKIFFLKDLLQLLGYNISKQECTDMYYEFGRNI